jgi:hypothetical protein
VIGTLNIGPMGFSDRVRIEELIGVPKDPWRYRNLVSVVVTAPILGLIKSLTASDEIFVDLSSGRLKRSRLLAGPVFELSRRIDLSIIMSMNGMLGHYPEESRAALWI